MDISTKAVKIQAIESEQSIAQRTENLRLNPLVDDALSSSPDWNFSQIFGKKRHVTTLNVTNAATGLIYTFDNTPNNMINLFSNIAVNDFFLFVKYNLVFELEVQSHFQHQGALILNVVPYSATGGFLFHIGLNPSTLSAGSRQSRTFLPHDFITFGHNGNYKVIMPWCCNRNMLPITRQTNNTFLNSLADYHINTFQISVFDQLQAVASAVGTSSIRIWAHVENLEYSGYVPRY